MLMMALEVKALVQQVKLETRNLIPVVAAVVVVAVALVAFDERGK